MGANTQLAPTLPMEAFWRWLKVHANCIVRAGGPGFALFDLPDIHWHLAEEEDGLLVAQLIRGKELAGELVFHGRDALYVQSTPEDGEQTLFECVGSTPDGPSAICYFVLAHPFDEEDAGMPPRWTH